MLEIDQKSRLSVMNRMCFILVLLLLCVSFMGAIYCTKHQARDTSHRTAPTPAI